MGIRRITLLAVTPLSVVLTENGVTTHHTVCSDSSGGRDYTCLLSHTDYSISFCVRACRRRSHHMTCSTAFGGRAHRLRTPHTVYIDTLDGRDCIWLSPLTLIAVVLYAAVFTDGGVHTRITSVLLMTVLTDTGAPTTLIVVSFSATYPSQHWSPCGLILKINFKITSTSFLQEVASPGWLAIMSRTFKCRFLFELCV